MDKFTEQNIIETGTGLLTELMLRFPKGAGDDSDQALAACVATYIEMRAKSLNVKTKDFTRSFNNVVQQWIEAGNE